MAEDDEIDVGAPGDVDMDDGECEIGKQSEGAY
jgi:hypothetical protein